MIVVILSIEMIFQSFKKLYFDMKKRMNFLGLIIIFIDGPIIRPLQLLLKIII